MRKIYALSVFVIFVFSCTQKPAEGPTSFGGDVQFLKKHTDLIVLKGQDGLAQLAVVPAYQGRVMTSTASGHDGKSFGWINYDLISSGKYEQHISVFGGEDRFWLGPEGGQFSIFFKKDTPFDLQNWYVPKEIDTEPFELIKHESDYALFKKKMQLINYSETQFDLEVKREIKVLSSADVFQEFSIKGDGRLKICAYSTNNQIKNTGRNTWTKETGMLSIWILGMFKPSPNTTVVISYKSGTVEEMGPVVNDAYFGKIAEDRLKITDDAVFFKGDGQYRSKIGISAKRSKPVLGSYDADDKVLTIVKYNQPAGTEDYINSMWELQEEPFAGDVVNSYNDGSASPEAEPLGPFYELETSSPAAALAPGDSLIHVNTTIHITGPEEGLDDIAKNIFGVSLIKIKTVFR